jgi:hypothetical protein
MSICIFHGFHHNRPIQSSYLIYVITYLLFDYYRLISLLLKFNTYLPFNKDRSGCMLHSNPSWDSLFKVKPTDIYGRPYSILQGPLTDRSMCITDVDRRLKSGKVAEAITYFHRGDGKAFLNHVIFVPGLVGGEFLMAKMHALSPAFLPLKDAKTSPVPALTPASTPAAPAQPQSHSQSHSHSHSHNEGKTSHQAPPRITTPIKQQQQAEEYSSSSSSSSSSLDSGVPLRRAIEDVDAGRVANVQQHREKIARLAHTLSSLLKYMLSSEREALLLAVSSLLLEYS